MKTTKKVIALLLAFAMALSLVACGSGGSKTEDSSAEVDTPVESTLNWSEFDEMITEIRNTTDLAARAELMHQAEDMLMDTWCVLPIYYYNDVYMMSDNMTGVYMTPFGMKFFNFASMNNGADAANICLAAEPDYLDPALNSSVDGGCLAVNSFEGLMTYDAEGNLVEGCAESYEVSEDGLTYTFTLRDGLKWSNGEDLTAADFEYSWKRAADVNTASDYSYLFEILADGQYADDGSFIALNDEAVVASEDGKTLTVTLGSVCPYFLDLCAFPTFFPVYEPTVTENNPDGTTPNGWCLDAGDSFVCNGPYVLQSWTHDASMTYVKNEYYRNKDNVQISTLNFMLSADDTAIYTAFQSGSLDFIDTVATDELGKLIEAKDPELYIVDELGTVYVTLNYNSELWDNLGLSEADACTFRKALCLLIDRDYIIENVALAGQTPATTFIPAACADGNGGTFKNKDYYSIDDYDANVEEAKSLLESIGFTFDASGMLEQTVAFTYITNSTDSNVKTAEALQADFAQIGIEMSIETEDWNVFLEDRKAGNYDIARGGWVMDYNDPINMLEMFTTNSGNNDCQFGR